MIGNMWLITSCWSMWRLFYCQRSNNKSFPKDCPWVRVLSRRFPWSASSRRENNRLPLVDDSWCFSVGLALAVLFLYSWLAIGFVAPILDLVTASMLEVFRVWRGLPSWEPSLSWSQLKHLFSKLLKPPMYSPPLKITLNPTQPPLHPPKPTVPTQAPHYQGETFPAATVLLRHQLHLVRFPK